MQSHGETVVDIVGVNVQVASAWYLVQCKASQDDRAEENLLRQGYTCFRPKHRCERIKRGRRLFVNESLFPSYLFINLSAYDNWAPLRSTRGVSRIVSFGGKPLAVCKALMAQLRTRDIESTQQAAFTRGEAVRVNEGPFVELEAIFLAMDGDERVVLLMNILEREQRLSLPLDNVSRVC